MKYLTISPIIKKMPLAFLSVTFYFLISSCSNQSKVSINSYTIPVLAEIPEEPVAHYKELSRYSAKANEQNDTLDDLYFPNKAQRLAIRIISPAYLSRDEIRTLVKQLKPPANSSEQTRKELDFLLKLQKTRTAEQVQQVLEMHDIVYFPIIGINAQEDLFYEAYEIFGDEFDPSQYPKTEKLLNNIMREMRIAEFTAKNHFLRARPRQLESRLKPLKKMKSSSFASGHTLWAYMQAYLMGALIPEQRKEFLNLAYEIGYSREVLGVHYPSDEEASRTLGYELLSKMWKNPQFVKDFYEAEMEWKN